MPRWNIFCRKIRDENYSAIIRQYSAIIRQESAESHYYKEFRSTQLIYLVEGELRDLQFFRIPCRALAEFERNLIRERTSAGLTAARARGRKGGRRRRWILKKEKRLLSFTKPGSTLLRKYARLWGFQNLNLPRNHGDTERIGAEGE
jgi:hypothetical protein